MNLHSEPLTLETHENRLSAHFVGRPRPPPRLQLHRKVTTQSSNWKIARLWQADRPVWYKYRATVWDCFWVRTHKSRETPMPSQKWRIGLRRKNGPQCCCGLIAWKILLRVSIQLLIFRYHGSTGAIDVLLLRFKCQQADHFVGALWICRKFSGVGTGAKIRWGGIVLEIEAWRTDSRSILPRYVLKNGSTCVDCWVCVWNLLHYHTLTSKTRTSRFSWTSPPRYHFLSRYTYLRQIDDSKPSVRTVCTHAEVRYHFSDNWVDSSVKLSHVVIFEG